MSETLYTKRDRNRDKDAERQTDRQRLIETCRETERKPS